MTALRLASPPVTSLDPQLDQLRQRIDFEGAAALSEAELLALLLGRGSEGLSVLELASRLLVQSGGLRGLHRKRAGSLLEWGLDLLPASRLAAALELGHRLAQEPSRIPERRLWSAEQVAFWALPRLGHLEHEEVWVLCVGSGGKLRSSWQVGRGGIHGCSLLPRDILGPVLREAASGFVLVHNHPSGDPSPSSEDVKLTRAVREVASLLGTPLLDHVVVAGGNFCSLFQDGFMNSEE